MLSDFVPVSMPTVYSNLYRDMWHTRDHQILRPEDMGDTHIINCIKMIQRNKVPYKSIANEVLRHGEVPADLHNREDIIEEIYRHLKMEPDEWLLTCPMYVRLLEEVDRRKIGKLLDGGDTYEKWNCFKQQQAAKQLGDIQNKDT